ncbi:hypothetical protein [Streptomyces microflavus]|uniref:hypothetical protein n=1 Tax=Streptomyces microflavus TaxID=1919 RepID=UPI003454BD0B
MLEIAASCGVSTAAVIWDRGQIGWPKERGAREILGYLYERIEMHLESREERGVVIADIPGGGNRDHTKWLAESVDLTTVGTTYVKPNRVVMPIVTAPSDHLPHLQLADLVTAATTAAVAGREAGMELVELLKPLARRNAHGYIGGAGLVLWPRSLTGPLLLDLRRDALRAKQRELPHRTRIWVLAARESLQHQQRVADVGPCAPCRGGTEVELVAS